MNTNCFQIKTVLQNGEEGFPSSVPPQDTVETGEGGYRVIYVITPTNREHQDIAGASEGSAAGARTFQCCRWSLNSWTVEANSEIDVVEGLPDAPLPNNPDWEENNGSRPTLAEAFHHAATAALEVVGAQRLRGKEGSPKLLNTRAMDEEVISRFFCAGAEWAVMIYDPA